MIRFDCNKVKPSSHLTVLTYRQKQAAVRERKASDRRATETVKRVRDFTAPVKDGFAPRGFGRKAVGLSAAKREKLNLVMAERAAKAATKATMRKAFFAAIESGN